MPKVNAKAGNALALRLGVNVTQMFAGIVGSGIQFSCLFVFISVSYIFFLRNFIFSCSVAVMVL